MTTQFLINNVRVGTVTRYAGSSYDSTADAEQILEIEASGGVLLDSTAGLIAASAIAIALRKAGAPPEESASAMLAGAVLSTMTAAIPLGVTGEMAAAGVAAANAAGSAEKSAPIDHAHAHGSQTVGTMHAAVVAAGASGFMTGADKTKLDGITPGAAVASVSGTAPIVSSGGTTPAISISAATSLAAGSMSAADKAKSDSMQAGRSTLSSGTRTVANVTITATSRIFVQMADPGAGAITGFASFDVPDASRVVGAPGSFDVNAIDDAKALIATAACTFDWHVIDVGA